MIDLSLSLQDHAKKRRDEAPAFFGHINNRIRDLAEGEARAQWVENALRVLVGLPIEITSDGAREAEIREHETDAPQTYQPTIEEEIDAATGDEREDAR